MNCRSSDDNSDGSSSRSSKATSGRNAVAEREALKQSIIRYHVMLTRGCGRPKCDNPNCKSSSLMQHEFATSAEALQCAISLTKRNARLCLDEPADADDNEEQGIKMDLANDKINWTHKEHAKAMAFTDAKSVKAWCQRFLYALQELDRCSMSFLAIDQEDEKMTDNDAESDRPLGELDPSIDFKLLSEAYDLFLENWDGEDIPAILVDGMSSVVSTVNEHLVSSTDLQTSDVMREMRRLLIMLQAELFLDPEHHELLQSLLEAWTSLVKEHTPLVVAWLSSYPLAQFERLLGILQAFISVAWYTLPNRSKLRPAIVAISYLYEANESRHLVGYTEFYNDVINEELRPQDDYRAWRMLASSSQRSSAAGEAFCFAHFPFLLGPAWKSSLLQLDATLQMQDSFENAIMRHLFLGPAGGASSPFLVIQVKRDSIIADTLTHVQGRAHSELKKPLKIKFEGEDGVDEGGVTKEFFQILVGQLFSPDFFLFTSVEDNGAHVYWFNKDSLESDLEFELIGIIFGLAIYNGVILEVRFPMAVYRKLLNKTSGFDDLLDFMPELHRGLKQLLEFDGDVEVVYQRTFSHEYYLFGEVKTVELKPGGSSIAVTKENRQEYVDLYVNYLINTSIQKQFDAFKLGFDLVCGGDVFRLLRPEELELIICGSTELDFEALESSTRYEDGFTKDSPVIHYFWRVVHSFSDEEKRKFLSFCTGSDRVPINGLGQLAFTISRNGGDSYRLPTSHTCFNHLLLPAYASEEKLRERLVTAIQNSQGFGLR